jgi:uncharacterized protein YjlB
MIFCQNGIINFLATKRNEYELLILLRVRSRLWIGGAHGFYLRICLARKNHVISQPDNYK